jgi:hypothetical protein
LTESGRQRLRDAALRNQPWQFSTGPRSPEGKAKAAMNGHNHRSEPQSRRQLLIGLAGVTSFLGEMALLRQAATQRSELHSAIAEEEKFKAMGIDGVPGFVVNGEFLFSGTAEPQIMVEAFRQAASSTT